MNTKMNDPPPQSKYEIDARDGKIGVVGDGTQVSEINIYEAPSGLGALLGRKGRTVRLTPDQQRRNRENLLSNVQATWIDGYLHNAVHHAIFMELGIEYKRDAVSRPWDLTLQSTNQPIPHDRPIGAVFREHGRSMLILGEPASGKTITMLQLAEELLAEAEQDASCPIPVILNLSSWAREQPPLADWLVEEMFVAYQVARPLTRAWLEANAFALLLDGLDEVDEAFRDDCIAAINDFRAEHQVDIVVCSRIAEYEALSKQLNLSTAIRIQPLTPEQIDAYLDQFGPTVDALRGALAHDQELQELGQSPLMLSLMPLAYGELGKEDMPAAASLEGKRESFFTSYVRRVFQQRPLPRDTAYDQSQALRWLTSLAQGMLQHGESLFYIERLQPSWLPSDLDRRRYYLSVGQNAGLAVGLICGLVVGLVVGTAWWEDSGLAGWLSGVLISLSGGVLLFGLVGEWVAMRIHDTGSRLDSYITLHEELRWSPPFTDAMLRSAGHRLVLGLVVGLVFGPLFWLVATLLSGQRFVLAIGLRFGLMLGLFIGLRAVLSFVLASIRSSQTQSRTRPNQGIRSSFRNASSMGLLYALLHGLTGGLIFGPLCELLARLDDVWSNQLLFGLVGGLFFGLAGGLVGLGLYGGVALVEHYTLRHLLAQRGILPFPFSDRRLVAYLDAMADRILLRRVGGGWMFIHRYLLEYFASLHPEHETNETL